MDGKSLLDGHWGKDGATTRQGQQALSTFHWPSDKNFSLVRNRLE
jgi:hypothetical protein